MSSRIPPPVNLNTSWQEHAEDFVDCESLDGDFGTGFLRSNG